MFKNKNKMNKSLSKKSNKFGKFSLTFRLILGITILITLLMAAVGYATFTRDSKVFLEEAYSRGWSTVHTVIAAAVEQQYREEPVQMNRLLKTVAQDKVVNFVVLINGSGTVLANNNGHLTGSNLFESNQGNSEKDTGTTDSGKSSLSEKQWLKQAVTQNQELTSFRYDQNGKPTLSFIAPVKDTNDSYQSFLYLNMDLSYLNSHLKNTVNNIIFNCVLAILAGILLTRLIIIRVVGRPVKDLVGVTEKVATGDFSEQIKVQSRDELGRLATAFNTMNGHLGILFQSIRNTVRDMTFAARLITQRFETGGDELSPEALIEIKTAAKRLVRLSDKLNSISGQFKTAEQAEEKI